MHRCLRSSRPPRTSRLQYPFKPLGFEQPNQRPPKNLRPSAFRHQQPPRESENLLSPIAAPWKPEMSPSPRVPLDERTEKLARGQHSKNFSVGYPLSNQDIESDLDSDDSESEELELTKEEANYQPTHPTQLANSPKIATPQRINRVPRELTKQPTRERKSTRIPHVHSCSFFTVHSTSFMSSAVKPNNEKKIKEAKTHPPDPGGYTQATVSFSRTCPIVLTYAHSGKSIEGLAIIDHWASHSLVDPSIIEDLDIKRQDQHTITHSSTTIHGTTAPASALIIEGLTIYPYQQGPQ